MRRRDILPWRSGLVLALCAMAVGACRSPSRAEHQPITGVDHPREEGPREDLPGERDMDADTRERGEQR